MGVILTVPTLGRCGGLEGTDCVKVPTLGRCGGLERTDF